MAGHDVLMVSGTDEHGTPILVQAEQEGVTPQQLADRYNRVIVEDLTSLGLSYDLFTRTTTRNHYAVVQEMFRTVHKNGYMVEKTTMGAISPPSTGRTLPDRFIEGTCPPSAGTTARAATSATTAATSSTRSTSSTRAAASTARRRSSSSRTTSSSTCRPSRTRWATGCAPAPGGAPPTC